MFFFSIVSNLAGTRISNQIKLHLILSWLNTVLQASICLLRSIRPYKSWLGRCWIASGNNVLQIKSHQDDLGQEVFFLHLFAYVCEEETSKVVEGLWWIFFIKGVFSTVLQLIVVAKCQRSKVKVIVTVTERKCFLTRDRRQVLSGDTFPTGVIFQLTTLATNDWLMDFQGQRSSSQKG